MKPVTLLLMLSLLSTACGQKPTQVDSETMKQSPQQLMDSGIADLLAGDCEAALEKLDQVVAMEPASEPYLWQRGIAQYLTGNFDAGRKQFELHRTVNPNDVENATWHFLCVSATEGPSAARKVFLPAPMIAEFLNSRSTIYTRAKEPKNRSRQRWKACLSARPHEPMPAFMLTYI